MFTFIKTSDRENKFDITELSMSVDALTTTDIVSEFRYFLLGCGFQPGSIKQSFEEIANEIEVHEEEE
jgi:hypothetical protein